MTKNTDNNMDDNNQESVEQENVSQSETVETQAIPTEDDEKNDPVKRKSLMWANWRIFVAPGRVRERVEKLNKEIDKAVEAGINSDSQSEADSNEELEDDDPDRFIPKTKKDRLIGLMDYIRNEEGTISIEELLCVDMILRREMSLSPHTPGIDRYDDWGVCQWSQGLREMAEYFFRITPQQRKKKGIDYEEASQFSPEIAWRFQRLSRMFHLPESKKANLAPSQEGERLERLWPDDLEGRDLELFKLLSGLETLSPHKQALDVLNYIVPDENTDENSVDGEPKFQFVPEDKERVKRLLKRFPILYARYPYLLYIIQHDLPIESFKADTNSDYLTIRTVPAPFFFPVMLAESIHPYKQPWYDKWAGWISKGLVIAVGAILIIFGICDMLGLVD